MSTAQATPTDAPGAVACAHCDLPVPKGMRSDEREEQFCCPACSMAYDMIRACDLDAYYGIAKDMRTEANAAQGTGDRYEELNAGAEIDDTDPGRHTCTLTLRGLHCAACVWLLERLPRIHDGALEARVSMPRARIDLAWDPGRTDLSSIARTIDRLGYRPHPHYTRAGAETHKADRHRALVRIGVAGAIAGNVMLASVALYAGEFAGIEPAYERLFSWVSMLLTALTLAWPGATFFRGAIASLRTRTPHIDLPVSLGLLVGYLAGAWHTVVGAGDIYFDSIATLVFFLLIGRMLQASQQERAFDAVAMTGSLTPRTARVLGAGGAADRPIEDVHPGDLVEVRAGETVPVDGAVEEGDTEIDRSVMTGESLPVRTRAGDPVHAGDSNLASNILVRVEHAGRDTKLAQLMGLVEDAMDRRAPIQILANRVAGVFVVAIIALAVATFALWAVVDPSRAISTTTALLIVTCPCALGLATPLCVAIGLGRAAKRGVFIKGGDVLERLAGRGTVVFDKTGTLTHGRLALVAWEGDEDLRDPVARAEALCDHPVARALAAGVDITGAPPAEIRHTAGRGLVALVDGMVLTVGSERFLREQGVAPPDAAMRASIDRAVASGASPVLVARAGEVRAVAHVGDELRPGVPELVRTLSALGWESRVLSGDLQGVTTHVARGAGIPEDRAVGGADPEEKAATVRRLAQRTTTLMVGDGVNDAGALAEASVGVAVSGGAEASLTAADVYLADCDLESLPMILEGAARTTRTIKRTIAFSITYNAVGATLAIAGVINPLLAAVLMPASSLTVLLLASRNRSFG